MHAAPPYPPSVGVGLVGVGLEGAGAAGAEPPVPGGAAQNVMSMIGFTFFPDRPAGCDHSSAVSRNMSVPALTTYATGPLATNENRTY